MPLRLHTLLALVALAACSEVPEATWPEHVDFAVTADYELGPTRTLVVPFSRADLTLFRLDVAPTPLAERFEAGERTLLFASDVERVEVRCKGRRYGRRVADLDALFPGATRLVAQ